MRSPLTTTLLLTLALGCSQQPETPPQASAAEGAEVPATVATTASEEQPPATTPAASPEPEHQMPPYAAMLTHRVKDFAAWKAGFDAHADARKQASIVAHGVMRGATDDKLVGVYLPATDPEKLQAFLEAKELKEAMKASGVQGKPTVHVFKSVSEKMAPPDKNAVVGTVVEFDVKDFTAFQQAIEAQSDVRSAAGVLGYGLGQSLKKPNIAYLYLQSDDAAKLKAYLTAKETKKAMKDAGARGAPPVPVLFKESEMVTYKQP
jgi:quinol monooxygenase YgiN